MSNNIIDYIITNLSIKGKNFKAICQGNRMKKSLIFVQNYLFFCL